MNYAKITQETPITDVIIGNPEVVLNLDTIAQYGFTTSEAKSEIEKMLSKELLCPDCGHKAKTYEELYWVLMGQCCHK